MPRRVFLLTVLIACCTAPAHAQTTRRAAPRTDPSPPGEQSLQFNGAKRTYLIHVPQSYDGTAEVPLVVLIHGKGSSSTQIAKSTGFAVASSKENFILVAPDGSGTPRGWNTGMEPPKPTDADDVGYIHAVLAEMQKWYRIDPDRVYVAGHASGAMMAYRLAAEMSDVFAAAAPVSGTMGMTTRDGTLRTTTQPAHPVSLIVLHGLADRLIPYRGALAFANATQPPPLVPLSVDESVAVWVHADGITDPPTMQDLKKEKLVITTYTGGKDETTVQLISYVEGGNAWPGPDATDAIWQFFKTHPKKR